MKYALPFFALLSMTVLLWASCTPQPSTPQVSASTSEVIPAASDSPSVDTTTYNRDRRADTLNPTIPTRPDSTNRMPPKP